MECSVQRNSYIDIDFVAISKISNTAVPQKLQRLIFGYRGLKGFSLGDFLTVL